MNDNAGLIVRSASNVTTVYLSIPEGRRIYGKVKLVEGTDDLADRVHPKKPHRWHEMLHYGQPGTGFTQCRCGAVGIPYKRRVGL